METHFAFEDGTAFIPFGTTVYALAHQEDALVEETLESLRSAPFNKVRMCVFPKHYDYNHNEPPCYAFEKGIDGAWNVNRPCIAFWQRFEKILDRIYDMEIQVDLILFHPYDRWGFADLSQRDNLIFLDYLLRRLAANPGCWWSLANEYDLCDEHKSLADWEEIEAYVANSDPYGHLLSNHNCFCFWDATRPNITHASLQTKGLTELPRWIAKYQKPVVIDECCYEGNLPAPLTSAGNVVFQRAVLSEEEREAGIMQLPKEMHRFLRSIAASIARMEEDDRTAHLAGEHEWASHAGEDAYLWFNDRQCFGEQTLSLPEAWQYRIELIDVWAMTRTVLLDDASGETLIRLPGREGLAVLATRTSQ